MRQVLHLYSARTNASLDSIRNITTGLSLSLRTNPSLALVALLLFLLLLLLISSKEMRDRPQCSWKVCKAPNYWS